MRFQDLSWHFQVFQKGNEKEKTKEKRDFEVDFSSKTFVQKLKLSSLWWSTDSTVDY